MPLSTETIRNTPLSGRELAKIIRDEVEKALAGDGMFSEYVGYGRVGFVIRITLEMDNLTYPKHDVLAKGGEALPLVEPGPDPAVMDVAWHHNLTSPNAERIRHDLPIEVTSVVNGQLARHQLTGYDKRDLPPQPDPVIEDHSAELLEKVKARSKKKSK